MAAPRDYRDSIDVDEALDAIRVSDRDRARELFTVCMDCAYAQGRVEGSRNTSKAARSILAALIGQHARDFLDQHGDKNG